MKKTPLIALRSQTYMTRRLQAGDAFLARPGEAKILKAQGKARDDYDASVKAALAQKPVLTKPATSVGPTQKDPDPEPDHLDDLRNDARALGVHVDGRWGEARLRHEIAMVRVSRPAIPSMAMTTESAPPLVPYSEHRNEE